MTFLNSSLKFSLIHFQNNFVPLSEFLASHIEIFIFPIFDLLESNFEYFLSQFRNLYILLWELLFLICRISSLQFLNSSLKSSLIHFRNIFIPLSEFLASHREFHLPSFWSFGIQLWILFIPLLLLLYLILGTSFPKL